MKIMLVFENIVFVARIMNIDQVIGDILAIDNIIRHQCPSNGKFAVSRH